MEREKLLVIVSLFLFLIQISYAQNVNSYEYIKLEITNDISFQVNMESKMNIEWFNLNSYFFPNTYKDAQHLNTFQTSNKNYRITNNSGTYSLIYSYDKNSLQSKNTISNKFVVESVVFRPEISTKISYPLTNIPEQYKQYLEFDDTIDIDANIRAQASAIAKGEDDVFIISSKVAKWIIEDVDYDLTTLFANPNQKSTEVFQSKSGVCREITNLYLSMMRSLGIPARVVTGYAYTESPELKNYLGTNWGGHAWAEVLIGDTWVPFDLTYNQYGFVDASHIITDKYKNIRSTSAAINASGYGFTLSPNSLNSKTSFTILDSKESTFNSGFSIELDGLKEIGFGSYGYVKVTAKNTENFYQVLFLKLLKAKEVALLDSEKKMLIFAPNEEKEIYFRFKLPENLSNKYIYTFPFNVSNEYINIKFEVKSQENFFQIKEIALPKPESEQKNLSSNNLEINCNFIIETPLNTIICSVKNPNNYEINNLNICSKEKCQIISLKLNEIRSITFKTDNFEDEISYIYTKEQKTISLSVPKPELEITSFQTAPEHFGLNYSISNYINNLDIHFILDNKTINITPAPQKSNLQLNIEQDGNHTIELLLKIGDKTLDTDSKNFTIEKKSSMQKFTEKNFIQKIIEWFKTLF